MVTNPNETKTKLLKGVNTLADAVKVTLGTKGRLIVYTAYRDFDDNVGRPILTKDGVTVARQVRSKDPVENQAIKIVREAAKNTVDSSGDGPQPLYAKVLTPTGFVEMGSLKVGQEICGTNGTIQKVLGIYPKGKKEICKVIFSDGKEVECCEDHLWKVFTYSGVEKILTTKEILDSGIYLEKSNGQKQYRFYVQKCFSEFENNPVPIDPYLLGLLIGDGSLSGTGDVELSLGLNKTYVIKNIDDSLIHSISYDNNRNYFRVKFKDENLIRSLKDLGLYGTKSDSKFIPEVYKYNSVIVREKLLQGLLDTDGYINDKDLFEYSTVSDSLKNDFIELISSMGISYNYRHHTRVFDKDSYSNKPIHRITQLKGYKYGDKIVNVVKTGEETEMMCIKVSNEDSLYITDNYVVTHNTTSTVILAQYMINEGYKLLEKGLTSYELNQQISEAVKDAKEYIEENSIDVYNDFAKLKELASISANSPEIGNLIYEIVDELGAECDIEVKKSQRKYTTVEAVSGMKLHKGYFAPFMCSDYKTMTFNAKDCCVLVYDGVIRDYNDVGEYIKAAIDESGNPLPILIYAKDVSKPALSRIENLMRYNPRPLMIVEHDGFGDRRIDLINDLAVITGAYIISEDDKINRPPANQVLGMCEEVIVSERFTSILGGMGDAEQVKESVEEIKERLGNVENYEKERRFLLKRIANLTGGVAVIHVGGNTPFEMEEEYMRIEDAVLAVKAAINAGISIGGAFTWERVSSYAINKKYNRKDHPAYFMVFDALKEILKQLLKNSGEFTEDFYRQVRSEYLSDNPKAYNLIDRKFYEVDEYKVYDATSVLLDALTNSSSVCKSILSVEVSIHNNNYDG